MRVFLDENMPRPLRRLLRGHDVSFVEEQGWKGKGNGELLALVEAMFDVMITSDRSMAYQQHLVGRTLSMLVVPTNNLTVLRANALAIAVTLDEFAEIGRPALIVVDWKGRRVVRPLDRDEAENQAHLAPVRPFRR